MRYKETFKGHVVISSQKAVAHATDKNGNSFIVPAGYALAMEANDTSIVYTVLDAQNKVKNAEGELVKAGESVIASMTAAGVKVSFIYWYKRITTYYVIQVVMESILICIILLTITHKLILHTICVMLMSTQWLKMLITIVLLFMALLHLLVKKLWLMKFVTYDMDSNFVLAEADGFATVPVKPERIIGQISK